MSIDSHVHVGWYVDRYHSPEDVTLVLRESGVNSIAVSSTSTCAEEYDLVIYEMQWLQEEWGENCYPFLWVTPQMFKSRAIDKMLVSGIKWRGIKMHWQAHPQFLYSKELTDSVLTYSCIYDLPVLLHTGEFPECEAKVFEDIISNYPKRTFILAHGRPMADTIFLLKKYSNVYVDTAFMPISHIIELINAGLSSRILWGSDVPINLHYYSSIKTTDYLLSRINNLKEMVSLQQFLLITEQNFKKIFT